MAFKFLYEVILYMISTKMKKRLTQHAKKHKGGMKGSHMRSMVRLIKSGKTFAVAHKEALKKG